MDRYLYTCEVNFLTLERAGELVPPEFASAWGWFSDHAGQTIPRLPMGNDAPKDLPLKIVRQAGIFSPSYPELPSRGAGKSKYVLSVHTGNARYPDRDLIDRGDGTWILDYSAHHPVEGSRVFTHFNDEMMNNLRDGVPIGVMVRQAGGGYRVLGLAFIEQYNAATDSFILHGPVNESTEENGFFEFSELGDVSEDERRLLEEWDREDERARALVAQVRRERQGAFREMVLDAYDGACAVTGVDVAETLQAAHIDPYRGRSSQVVANGLLLRSDIHLLYDAHLLTVTPGSREVLLSDRLRDSVYNRLVGRRIAIPADPRLQPSDRLLAMHHRQFCIEQGIRV